MDQTRITQIRQNDYPEHTKVGDNAQQPTVFRALHVITTLAPKLGGSVECAKQITAALQLASCSVEIVCVDSVEAAWLENYSITVHALGRPRLDIFYSPSLTLLRWLTKNVARFDVVIIHGLWQFHSVAAAVACTRADIPYLVYAHGMLMRNSLLNGLLKFTKKAVYWVLVERWVLRAAASVLYTSKNEVAWSDLFFFRTSCRGVNIGNGIAIPSVAIQNDATEFPQKATVPTLLALGRLHPVKGLDALLRATHLLGECAPIVLIAGTGSPEYESALRNLSASLHLEERVHFIGEVAGQKKWLLLASSWALIAPSLHENFGIAIVEALSIATPVIVTQDVGIWREIEEAGAGITYRGGPEQLASAMQQFLHLPEKTRMAMAAKAKTCYERNFQISVSATNLITLVKSIIRENK